MLIELPPTWLCSLCEVSSWFSSRDKHYFLIQNDTRHFNLFEICTRDYIYSNPNGYTTVMFCISFNGQMRGIMQKPMEYNQTKFKYKVRWRQTWNLPCIKFKDFAKLVLNFSGIPMEVFLILIHIVLFSSDNLDPFQSLTHKREIENIQTEYMLFLHRWARGGRVLIRIQECFEALYYSHKSSKSKGIYHQSANSFPQVIKYQSWFEFTIILFASSKSICFLFFLRVGGSDVRHLSEQ